MLPYEKRALRDRIDTHILLFSHLGAAVHSNSSLFQRKYANNKIRNETISICYVHVQGSGGFHFKMHRAFPISIWYSYVYFILLSTSL